MKESFKSKDDNLHIRSEEKLWAEILASGNPYAGMILLYDQKLCAVAHEITKAMEEEYTGVAYVQFYASRLKSRINDVLKLVIDSGAEFETQKMLEGLLTDAENLRNDRASYAALKLLAEQVHETSHELCDELYNKLPKD